jgi:LPS sulfotransferase NodH
MANEHYIHLLRQGPHVWNAWREEHQDVLLDLSGANLAGANLSGANLAGANLSGANLAGANLSEANLAGTYLQGANLQEANLDGADIQEAHFERANLRRAYLFNTDHALAHWTFADLSGASGTTVSVRTPLGSMPFILEENRTVQPHTSYLICSTMRSGSYLLCEALQQTGLAGRPSEYFLEHTMPILSRQWDISSYSGYLNKVIEVATTPNGVFGMKVHLHQFLPLLDTLQQLPWYRGLEAKALLSTVFPNLAYIWIMRRDKVRQAVSTLKALQTNIWFLTDRPPMPPGEPTNNTPSFDPEAIDFLLRLIEREERAWQDYFNAHAIKPLVVIYEELVQTYNATACQVLKYLHIPKPANLVEASPHMKRQADEISEEWVERYQKLKRTEPLAS